MGETDPYDPLVTLVTLPVDIAFLDQSVYGNSQSTCGNPQVFRGLGPIAVRVCISAMDRSLK